MLLIFLKTMPFFLIFGLGYFAAKRRLFDGTATANLTKFVFYFALPAMIFRFTANLSLDEVFQVPSVAAYLCGTTAVYLLAAIVAFARRTGVEEAVIEAQSAAIGNVGFLGIPMLAVLMGPQAVGPVMLVLAIDMIIFGSLTVIVVSAHRDGRVSLAVLGPVFVGLLKNPMITAMAAGLIWTVFETPVPGPITDFLTILGAAATPGALFAIGASLAAKSAEGVGVAIWLTTAKIALHPIAVALAAFVVFEVPPFTAAVMVAAAAMPTAGNIYILAQHYGIAPTRVSSTIFISTLVSILSLTLVITLVSG